MYQNNFSDQESAIIVNLSDYNRRDSKRFEIRWKSHFGKWGELAMQITILISSDLAFGWQAFTKRASKVTSLMTLALISR